MKSRAAEVANIAKKIKNCHFPPFKIKFGMFSKKNQKEMRWTSLEYVVKTNRLQVISFLNSENFSTFHVVSRLFANTNFAKTGPKLELLLS